MRPAGWHRLTSVVPFRFIGGEDLVLGRCKAFHHPNEINEALMEKIEPLSLSILFRLSVEERVRDERLEFSVEGLKALIIEEPFSLQSTVN